MPANASYAIVMFLAGVGVPILAALNAALGQRIGAPFAACVVLFAVALAIALVVMLLTGSSGGLSGVPAQPRHLPLAGVLIAFYVLSITWIAPRFGVGNAVFFVLLGQLVSAGLIDHFGLFSARPSPITLTRALGIATMAVGVWLTQRA